MHNAHDGRTNLITDDSASAGSHAGRARSMFVSESHTMRFQVHAARHMIFKLLCSCGLHRTVRLPVLPPSSPRYLQNYYRSL